MGPSNQLAGLNQKDEIRIDFASSEKGMAILNIALRRRIQDDNFKLAEETKSMSNSWIELRLTGKRMKST
jgi:hypothetical protein